MIIQLEKALTALAMPAGLIWLVLIALCIVTGRRRHRRLTVVLIAAAAFYTVAGTGFIGGWLAQKLEDPFRQIDVSSGEPFDALVVLGGGTTVNGSGQVQMNGAGDRVFLAARLYHAGRVRTLVATGGSVPPPELPRLSPSSQSARVWRDLGVPAESIVEVAGENTSQEMQALAALLPQRNWKRVGLVTSAWHMGRALRLATAAGLDLQPVPTDFHSGLPAPWRLSSIVPNGAAMGETELVLKELLARLVSR